MIEQIQIRRDTAANWTSANPTLAQGEPALETDTGFQKMGDGVTAWNSLAYALTKAGLASTTSATLGQGLVGFNPALSYPAGTLPAALASPATGQGAALVVDALPGGVAQTQHAINYEVNVLKYGANPIAADNTAAFNEAIAYLVSLGVGTGGNASTNPIGGELKMGAFGATLNILGTVLIPPGLKIRGQGNQIVGSTYAASGNIGFLNAAQISGYTVSNQLTITTALASGGAIPNGTIVVVPGYSAGTVTITGITNPVQLGGIWGAGLGSVCTLSVPVGTLGLAGAPITILTGNQVAASPGSFGTPAVVCPLGTASTLTPPTLMGAIQIEDMSFSNFKCALATYGCVDVTALKNIRFFNCMYDIYAYQCYYASLDNIMSHGSAGGSFSATTTNTSQIITVTGPVSGIPIMPGAVLSGPFPAGTSIQAFGTSGTTGTGGAGTYSVSSPANTSGSGTVYFSPLNGAYHFECYTNAQKLSGLHVSDRLGYGAEIWDSGSGCSALLDNYSVENGTHGTQFLGTYQRLSIHHFYYENLTGTVHDFSDGSSANRKYDIDIDYGFVNSCSGTFVVGSWMPYFKLGRHIFYLGTLPASTFFTTDNTNSFGTFELDETLLVDSVYTQASTVSITAGVMTVAGLNGAAGIGIGTSVYGPNISALCSVVSSGTGTGGNGTYNVTGVTTAASGPAGFSIMPSAPIGYTWGPGGQNVMVDVKGRTLINSHSTGLAVAAANSPGLVPAPIPFNFFGTSGYVVGAVQFCSWCPGTGTGASRSVIIDTKIVYDPYVMGIFNLKISGNDTIYPSSSHNLLGRFNATDAVTDYPTTGFSVAVSNFNGFIRLTITGSAFGAGAYIIVGVEGIVKILS